MKIEDITPAASRLVVVGAVVAVVAATAMLMVRSIPENASALLFILAVIAEVVVAPIPGGAIAYIGAARFGFWQAWPLLYIGNVVGTILVFVLVRRFGAPLFRTSISEGTRRRYDWVLHDHAGLLWLVYSVPLMPLDILSILAGLSSIPARKFLTITMTGYLTYTGIVAFLGDFAADVIGAPEAMAGLCVILLGALIGWFWPRPTDEGRVGTDRVAPSGRWRGRGGWAG